MDKLAQYADRPLAFLARYARRHPLAHAAILAAVAGAVGCSVASQYSVKFLVDTLSGAAPASDRVWLAFSFLALLLIGDNLLWRVAGWIASHAFVAVTGDLRGDLFRYLTGHAPTYFQDRLPGTLASRITATSNAMFTIENMCAWNVLPPILATLVAIAFLAAVDLTMTFVMVAVASAMAYALFRVAAAGKPLHLGFADRAAAVDGEMVDILGNMPLVKAFGGLRGEHRRFDDAVGDEMTARRRSLRYLEKLRLTHALATIVFTIALLAWAIVLWRRGAATTGDVVLVSTLGFTILHATRDLAVALVDVTQHLARLSEAIAVILLPYALRDHPAAAPLEHRQGVVAFENVYFSYPGGRGVFENLSLRIDAGRRIGLVGPSGGGKSTLLALLQRFYDVQDGHILIDGQDIARSTQVSLR
jgi:ATP-binding cassette subfamily B protein